MGWVFAQPVRLIVGDSGVSGATRASGTISIPLATVAGLMFANGFCFLLTALLLYHFTLEVFDRQDIALLASLLWATSFYAYGWSYHPVDQMGGLVMIFAFPWLLWRVTRKPTLAGNALLGLGMGILMLMKAYYVLPFIYVVWAILFRFDLKAVIAGFILSFIPTFLWQRAYVHITGAPFVDYQLGAGGIVGYLVQHLGNFSGLFSSLITNFINFPRIILNSAGWPIALAALGFYITKGSQHVRLTLLSGIWLFGFFLFLTLADFFIPRHGSDFFPFIYPAAAFVGMSLWDRMISTKARALLILAYLLYTVLSFTLVWICVSEVL